MTKAQKSNLELFLEHRRYVNELYAQQSNLNCISFDTDKDKIFLNEISNKKFRNILEKEPASARECDYEQLVEMYYEALAVVYLNSKNVKVKKIREANVPTPDFECLFSNENGYEKKFYIEVKTLGFVGGESQYKKRDEETLNTSIGLEEQRKQYPNQKIYMAMRESHGWGEKLNNPTEERSIIIETLIQKIDKLIKSGQFSKKPTFLLVFANRLCNGLLRKSDLVSYYFDTDIRSVGSGLLWTVCFAEEQHLILKVPYMEGNSNQERRLKKNGVLVNNTDVSGIIFVDSFCNKNMRVFGLYDESRQSYDDRWNEIDTNELFYKITDAFSGKRNEDIYYELYKNLKNELRE